VYLLHAYIEPHPGFLMDYVVFDHGFPPMAMDIQALQAWDQFDELIE
jgi:hypothetical protein